MRSHVDALRPVLGIVFLAGTCGRLSRQSHGGQTLPGVGAVLFVISVPWSSVFHRAFALAAFVALGAVIFTGRFHFADFLGGCLRTSGSWRCCSSQAWRAIRSRQPAMKSRSGP